MLGKQFLFRHFFIALFIAQLNTGFAQTENRDAALTLGLRAHLDVLLQLSKEEDNSREAWQLITKHFPHLILERALQWPEWVKLDDGRDKKQTVAALQVLDNAGFQMTGEAIVQPSWQSTPDYPYRYRKLKKMLQKAVIHRITDITMETRDYTHGWVVLDWQNGSNELVETLKTKDVIRWFTQARSHLPNSPLYFSLTASHQDNRFTLENLNTPKALLETLLKADAPVDGICIKIIVTEESTPDNKELQRLLDYLGSFNLPIIISHLSITQSDPQKTKTTLLEYLAFLDSHPSVEHVFMSDIFAETSSDQPGLLFNTDYTLTPAGKAALAFTSKKTANETLQPSR